MKVLWIVNMLFPEAQAYLDGYNNLKSSGGWMIGSSNAILNKYN